MGDIDSAHESATGDLAGVGYTLALNEMGYIGGGNDEGVAYTYTVNGLTITASHGQSQAASADNESAVGVAYTVNGITLAAGTADDGAVSQTSFSVAGSFAGLGLKAVVLDNNNSGTSHGEIGISATYAVDDALSLTAFARSIDNLTGADTDYTGVGFAYSLGGGATVKGGYINDGAADGYDLMDLGLTFSF